MAKRFGIVVLGLLSLSGGGETPTTKAKGLPVYWGQECQIVTPGVYVCQLNRDGETIGDFEFTIEEAHHFANWLQYNEEEIGKYYCEGK